MNASKAQPDRAWCPFDLAATFAEAQAYTLAEVAKRTTGRGARRPHIKTVERWCRGGRRAGGRAVVLPSLVIGKQRRVMPQWLAAWQRELARAAAGD